MCSWLESARRAAVLALAAGAVWVSAPAGAQVAAPLTGLGRPATASELAAWDIDVRPDLKGLPPGAGSVAQGQVIWEAQCASCHGIFGESNQVFSPLVGGTTDADIQTGHVARLLDPAYPGRTTLMKLATLSTLWDYIRRAMPWNAPKSLKTDEVYAVTAYLLNLGGVLPDDFVLSDRTFAQAQARLPNRNGMDSARALSPASALGRMCRPDVKAVACMKNCGAEPTVASLLPDFARNNHGNLAEQNRTVGAQRGVDTRPVASAAAAGTLTPSAAVGANAAQGSGVASAERSAALSALLQPHNCLVCHALASRRVGPSFTEVSDHYAARPDAVAYLSAKIMSGGMGVWGQVPMPPQALSREDAKAIAGWLADGARK